jgi:mono/diheme cytochrome c family protein
MKSVLAPATCFALIVCLGCSDGESSNLPLGASGSPGFPVGGASAGSGGAAGASTGGSSGGSFVPPAGGGSGGAVAGGASMGGAGAGAGGGATAGAGGNVPLDGPSLYMANCQACHGIQGVGGPLGPELQHPVRDYSAWVVRHGLPGSGFPKPMEVVGPEKLSDASLELIWSYLDQPPQPTTGQALYHDYCGNCHGADGKGGPTTRNILNELAKLKEQVRKGTHLGEFAMRREYMPMFSTSRLSDAELDLIYKYVDSL